MNVVAIVPVKISDSSSKWMLRDIQGKTPLEHTVLGLIDSGLYNDVIIAAANDGHGEYYSEIASRSGAKLFLGEEDNITKRIKSALSEHRYTDGIAVRVNGENIFNLPSLAEKILDAVKGGVDYAHLCGLPNGLAPDAISITALQEHEEMKAPYYRTLRVGIGDVPVKRVDTGFELEEISFAAFDDEAGDLFNHLSSALPRVNIEQFLESARCFYSDRLESAANPQKRKMNFKLNAVERGLKLDQLSSMPVGISLGISDLCNLKCVTCVQSFNNLTQEEFNSEFEEAVIQGEGIGSI